MVSKILGTLELRRHWTGHGSPRKHAAISQVLP